MPIRMRWCEALASSQLAVETVATVRDKVVEAYPGNPEDANMNDQSIYDILRQAVDNRADVGAAAGGGTDRGGGDRAVSGADLCSEKHLTFVPKVGAMLVVFWASMSFMTATLVAFFHDRIIPMIAGG